MSASGPTMISVQAVTIPNDAYYYPLEIFNGDDTTEPKLSGDYALDGNPFNVDARSANEADIWTDTTSGKRRSISNPAFPKAQLPFVCRFDAGSSSTNGTVDVFEVTLRYHELHPVFNGSSCTLDVYYAEDPGSTLIRTPSNCAPNTKIPFLSSAPFNVDSRTAQETGNLVTVTIRSEASKFFPLGTCCYVKFKLEPTTDRGRAAMYDLNNNRWDGFLPETIPLEYYILGNVPEWLWQYKLSLTFLRMFVLPVLNTTPWQDLQQASDYSVWIRTVAQIIHGQRKPVSGTEMDITSESTTDHGAESHWLYYNRVDGATKFTDDHTSYLELDKWLSAYRSFLANGSGAPINCYDQSAAVQAALALRYPRENIAYEYMKPFGYISGRSLVGWGPCNNPYTCGDIKAPIRAKDPLPANVEEGNIYYASRSAFRNHIFVTLGPPIDKPADNAGFSPRAQGAFNDRLIVDACYGPFVGDVTRASYLPTWPPAIPSWRQSDANWQESHNFGPGLHSLEDDDPPISGEENLKWSEQTKMKDIWCTSGSGLCNFDVSKVVAEYSDWLRDQSFDDLKTAEVVDLRSPSTNGSTESYSIERRFVQKGSVRGYLVDFELSFNNSVENAQNGLKRSLTKHTGTGDVSFDMLEITSEGYPSVFYLRRHSRACAGINNLSIQLSSTVGDGLLLDNALAKLVLLILAYMGNQQELESSQWATPAANFKSK